MVAIAFLAQAAAVEKNSLGGLFGNGVEVPVIRGEKPGPAEDVAGSDDLDAGWASITTGFEGDGSADDEMKAIGGFAGFDHQIAGGETGLHGTFRQDVAMPAAQLLKERMRRQRLGRKWAFGVRRDHTNFISYSCPNKVGNKLMGCQLQNDET